MNRRIMDIFNYLVEKILKEKREIESGIELIEDLVKMGFKLDEIDEAFNIIFSTPNRIVLSNQEGRWGRQGEKPRRVFSYLESQKLDGNVRGVLTSLYDLSLLNGQELEEVLDEAMSSDFPEVGLEELQLFLMRIIDDEERLPFIFRAINDSRMGGVRPEDEIN